VLPRTKDSVTSPDGLIRASVNLRGDVSVYLSSFEVETKDGAVTAIEREGHRYAYSHTLSTGGYRAADYNAVGQQNLYVFTEVAN
jgi:hypothetical protein